VNQKKKLMSTCSRRQFNRSFAASYKILSSASSSRFKWSSSDALSYVSMYVGLITELNTEHSAMLLNAQRILLIETSQSLKTIIIDIIIVEPFKVILINEFQLQDICRYSKWNNVHSYSLYFKKIVMNWKLNSVWTF
jgi:hypothetical protein